VPERDRHRRTPERHVGGRLLGYSSNHRVDTALRDLEERVPCNRRAFFSPQAATINASGMTLDEIASALGTYADRTVVNRTGLKGEYDFLLKFRPEAGGPMGTLAPPLSAAADPASDLATLATAVQEQLGLKLESARGPVQVLVIQSVSPPVED
jgi:uncharacterized protein (TIGR03435 family)